ncbi:MAG: tryptophan--tRNA ligase [Candidatus Heimdallarchaeota archaeon]|nr:tryptophan--tRNA ligase [Candidatus Heimdallarchaeota archaeon]
MILGDLATVLIFKEVFQITRQMNLSIDTFTGTISDYERAMLEFGIEDISEVVDSLEKAMLHSYLRRGIMFGHTDAQKIFQSAKEKKSFAVMTGIKPTGQYHIGSLITCNEVLYFQKLGGKVYFCIADMESFLHNGLSLKDGHKTAIDNIADILALGLDYEKSFIYKQSEEKNVLRLATMFSKNVTYNMMKAIYGEQKFGAYQSALIQAADILLPQLKQYEGPIQTITPVGLEQAPHARLTRDLARKQLYLDEFGFEMPSFTFHQILGALDGSEKMSKSAGSTFILTLAESEKSLKQKIAAIVTGGRDTKKEQLELGGQPENCRVFDLYKFFFIMDDKTLAKRKVECKSGKILCGECKQDLEKKANDFIQKHQTKKSDNIDLAKLILEK